MIKKHIIVLGYFQFMANFVKYSYCTTVYNSLEVISRFYESISKSMTDNSELVIVDSFSSDGTYEKLLEIKEKDSRVKIIRKKCLRGKGRQIAIENSNGEIIVMIDVDVEYLTLINILREFEEHYENKLLACGVGIEGFNMGFVLGKKKTFYFLGGYPNLNNAEDSYLFKVAQCTGFLEKKTISEYDVKPISIKGLRSGNEKRYAKNVLETIKRRFIATRDILFVFNDFKPADLIKWYKLKGFRKYLMGYPLFVIGKLLRFTIKDEVTEKRCSRILHSINTSK